MSEPDSRTLVAVLSNPPLTDGRRTLRRVELAAQLLGFDQFQVANLFAVPSHASGALAQLGRAEAGWDEARGALSDRLAAADGVLLAYGCTAPTGEARHHFRRQAEWLLDRTVATATPTWCVGDGPRHPSRWQRWTSRTHPDLVFPDALRASLTRLDLNVPWVVKTPTTPRPSPAPTPQKDD